jgi:hypothetical protein
MVVQKKVSPVAVNGRERPFREVEMRGWSPKIEPIIPCRIQVF